MKIRQINLPSTPSTQQALKELLPQWDAPYMVVTAEYQTAGRGQGSNRWESAAGQNLLFSLGLHPTNVAAAEQFLLSEATALGLADVLSEWVDIHIKWPNDLYVGECKLGGILIECDWEGSSMSQAYVGVGLNVNQCAFVSDAPNPISLAQLVGHPMDRAVLLERLLAGMVKRYEQLAAGETHLIAQDYAQRLYRQSGWYPYQTAAGETFRAMLVSVSPRGILTLRDEGGDLRQFSFKEVVYLHDWNSTARR